jgi:hypothetical protein
MQRYWNSLFTALNSKSMLMQRVERNTDNNSFLLVSLLLFANCNCFNFLIQGCFFTVLCYIVYLSWLCWFTLIGSYFWLVRFHWIIPHGIIHLSVVPLHSTSHIHSFYLKVSSTKSKQFGFWLRNREGIWRYSKNMYGRFLVYGVPLKAREVL